MTKDEIKSRIVYSLFKALYHKDKIYDKDEFICGFMDLIDEMDGGQSVIDKLLDNAPEHPEEEQSIEVPTVQNGRIEILV